MPEKSAALIATTERYAALQSFFSKESGMAETFARNCQVSPMKLIHGPTHTSGVVHASGPLLGQAELTQNVTECLKDELQRIPMVVHVQA